MINANDSHPWICNTQFLSRANVTAEIAITPDIICLSRLVISIRFEFSVAVPKCRDRSKDAPMASETIPSNDSRRGLSISKGPATSVIELCDH